MCTCLCIHLFCRLSRSGLPDTLAKLANFFLNNIQPQQHVFKEVLVSRSPSLLKQQEFNVLAMSCQLYVGQEFARFHVGIQLAWTMFQIQVITCLSMKDLTDISMHLICQIKQFLRVLIAALLNSTYRMEKQLQVVEDFG